MLCGVLRAKSRHSIFALTRPIASVVDAATVLPDHVNPYASSPKYVGGHVSMAEGIERAPINAANINAKCFALFLKSGRRWESPPIPSANAEQFKANCAALGYTSDLILPHASYLINLASPDPATIKKSRAAMIDELKRCEQLGLTMWNFHPGSSLGKISVEEAARLVSESINEAHKEVPGVTLVIENTAGGGSTIGVNFEQIRTIIDGVQDKARVGVCLDTQHMFASGYDHSTHEAFNAVFKQFDEVVGWKYLKAIHLNDSKTDLGSRADRHEDLGKGKIGMTCFTRLMNDPRFDSIPMILETPGEYKGQIAKMYSLEEK